MDPVGRRSSALGVTAGRAWNWLSGPLPWLLGEPSCGRTEWGPHRVKAEWKTELERRGRGREIEKELITRGIESALRLATPCASAARILLTYSNPYICFLPKLVSAEFLLIATKRALMNSRRETRRHGRGRLCRVLCVRTDKVGWSTQRSWERNPSLFYLLSWKYYFSHIIICYCSWPLLPFRILFFLFFLWYCDL